MNDLSIAPGAPVLASSVLGLVSGLAVWLLHAVSVLRVDG